jgi:Predicted multitransmembrane protein
MKKKNGIWFVAKNMKLIERKYIILYFIIAAVLTAGVIAVFHNYNWYDTPIIKIKSVENSANPAKGNAREKYYDQTMTGKIMNGEHQGQTLTLKNEYSLSGVLSDRYKTGNELFVKLDRDGNGGFSATILGMKRDKYMAVLLALFIFLMVVVTSRKGFFSILSLAINIAVLWCALNLNYNGHNILMISNFLVVFFTLVSALFIGGLKKITYITILSTLAALCLTMMLFHIVSAFTAGVDYTYMEYIAGQNNLSELFLSQMLLGGLGAIMDVAITEASAINELIDKDLDITTKELVRSGREVGHDIMGTMINVMLFTYVCGIIPLIMLKMKNNISLHTIILWQIPMELYRFLIGSIGILLTIPISIFVSILLFRKVRKPAC